MPLRTGTWVREAREARTRLTPWLALSLAAALMMAFAPVLRPACGPSQDPFGARALLAPCCGGTSSPSVNSTGKKCPYCVGTAEEAQTVGATTHQQPHPHRDQVIPHRYRGLCPICKAVKAYAWGSATTPGLTLEATVDVLALLRLPQEAFRPSIPVFEISCRGPPLAS